VVRGDKHAGKKALAKVEDFDPQDLRRTLSTGATRRVTEPVD
jgi:hypothetical protein